MSMFPLDGDTDQSPSLLLNNNNNNDDSPKLRQKKSHFQQSRMPYVFVRENAIKYWCTVQGLSHNEMRVLAEKVQDQPEAHDDRNKKAEFSLPTWLVLNALEVMGFKVVTSGPYVTGHAKHDQREFVWTLHKTHDEWESSSK